MAAAARRMVDPFAEHGALMKELYHEYQRQDDLESMALVGVLLQEAAQTAKKRQANVQGLISDLCRSMSDLEGLSTYPEPEELHAKRMSALRQETHSAQSTTAQLQQELRQLEERKEALSMRKQAAGERQASVEKAAVAEETMLRHQLSLFAHISKVTWQLDRLDPKVRLAGTVSDPKSGDLRPFDIDARNMDEFAVVNALWNLV